MLCSRGPKGEGAGTYVYERLCRGGGDAFGDGTCIVYANGAYRGDDEPGSLMRDFSQRDPDKIANDLMRKRVQYLKRSEKGIKEVCEALEEMVREAENAGMRRGMQQNLLENVRSLMETVGWSPQQALESLRVSKPDWPRCLTML